MTKWVPALVLVAWCCLTIPAWTQVPGVPGVPGAGAAGAAGTAGGTAAAPPKTIWSFLGLSQAKCQECKQKLCKTVLGQMINSMLTPISMFSGGLVGGCCPTVPSAQDLANLAQSGSPAESAAAQIKADEANAKARRAAVRYLGTVDCHVWHEAEKGLIASLRADRNECVRLEAAIQLGNGCCCTKKTVEALTLVVNGSEKDGNPSETSERVKMAAMMALERCQDRVTPKPVDPADRKELPPTPPESPPVQPTSLWQRPVNLPRPATVEPPTAEEQLPTRLTTGRRNLYQVLIQAAGGGRNSSPPQPRETAPPPVLPAYSLATPSGQ